MNNNKANPTLIGVFLIGAIFLILVALFTYGSGQMFKKQDKFILYFESSVNGLDVGAPVKFKGVKIGQVERIMIRYNQADNSARVPVLIEIDTGRLKQELGVTVNLSDPKEFLFQVNSGLRGKLEYQSYVTGKFYIELDYYQDERPIVLVQKERIYKEIPTIESNMKELWETALNSLSEISKIDFAGISNHLDSAVKKLDNGLGDINFKGLNDSFIGASNSVKKLADSVQKNVNPIAGDIHNAVADLRETLKQIQGAVSVVYDLSDPESTLRYGVDDALTEFTHAARSIGALAEYLERNPSALLTGKGPSVIDNSKKKK